MMKKIIITFFILSIIAISGCMDSAEETLETADDVINTVEQISDAIEDTEINETIEERPQTNYNHSDSITIAAFNIQVFGQSKSSKPEVMEVITDIVKEFDIIAIQEIRDKSETTVPGLIELVNSDGSEYDYVISERLGRTSSKEQYAYLYNTQTVKVQGDPQTYPEPNGTDPFHREPYIASFKSISGDFDTVLIVVHTDPDEATEEIQSLDDVLTYAQSIYPEEGDFAIIGDLNADGNYFNEDEPSDLDNYNWVIDDTQDTTTKGTEYTYDRIILTDSSELGNFGVYRFDLIYNLTEEETVSVSDHYPVFAEFNSSGDMD